MSDGEHAPQAAGEPPAPGGPETVPGAAPPRTRDRAVAFVLAGALVLVVALVATAPLWAPLLPWRPRADTAERALAVRLDRLDAAQADAQRRAQQTAAETSAALQRIGQRLGALETRPAVPANDIAALRQDVQKLSGGTADLGKRIDAVEKAEQEAAAGAAALGRRLDALEAKVKTQAARDNTGVGLALVLLQIRSAVAAGRPFAAEYDALAGLARSEPELTKAAAPLAEPAKTGVASRAVLVKQLHALAAKIATIAGAPGSGAAAAQSWADQALARLRGLVTIRRADGDHQSGAAATISAAELALAGGDLAGAVANVEKLTGAAAEAARPWLGMARRRLAVETALRQIEARLTQRLGSPAAAPASNG